MNEAGVSGASERPPLDEAFPEGDVWRFAPGLAEQVLVVLLLVGAGGTVLLLGRNADVPGRFLVALGLAGSALAAACARTLLRQVLFTPDSFVVRGALGRREVPWGDVAEARLVPTALVERDGAGAVGVVALIGAAVLAERELRPHVTTDGNWIAAAASAVLGLGAYVVVRTAWTLAARRRGRGGQGRVLTLRAGDGRVLGALDAWPDRRAQDALEGVLRFHGIPFVRRAPDDPL